MASRLAGFSRHRWLPYCLVGIVWVLQHGFIPFIPDWRPFSTGASPFFPACSFTWRLLAHATACPAHHRSLDDGPYGRVHDLSF
jgi:hypothetical protein